MIDKNNAEPNLDDMDLDQLMEYQDKLREEDPETTQPTADDPEPDNQDGQTASESAEVVKEPEPEAAAKPEEGEPAQQSPFVSPFLKGKSVEEVKTMIQKQQEYILQQSIAAQELESLYVDNNKAASELERVKGETKKRITQPAQPEPQEDDPLAIYDPETVKATETLVERLIERKQKAVIQEYDNNRNENYSYYQTLQQNPALFSVIKPVLEKEVEANPKVVYQKGWMQQAALSAINSVLQSGPQTTTTTVDKSKVIERKKAASTVSGGGYTPAKPQKSEDDMSPEEYLQHMKEKGLVRVQ